MDIPRERVERLELYRHRRIAAGFIAARALARSGAATANRAGERAT
jgi:hypothetical protein